MTDSVLNFGKANVSTGYDAAATEIALEAGFGKKFPAPPTDEEYNLVWWNITDYPDPADDPNVEIIRVVGLVADVMTIERAQESSAATPKNIAGKTYRVSLGVTAKMIKDVSGLRTTSIKTSATPTPDSRIDDIFVVTGLAVDAEFARPLGRPVNGQQLIIRITDDGVPRSLTWDDAFTPLGANLPSATTTGASVYVGVIYNSELDKWECVAGNNSQKKELYSLGTPINPFAGEFSLVTIDGLQATPYVIPNGKIAVITSVTPVGGTVYVDGESVAIGQVNYGGNGYGGVLANPIMFVGDGVKTVSSSTDASVVMITLIDENVAGGLEVVLNGIGTSEFIVPVDKAFVLTNFCGHSGFTVDPGGTGTARTALAAAFNTGNTNIQHPMVFKAGDAIKGGHSVSTLMGYLISDSFNF